MKRQLAALLLTIFALSLTACGETAAESETRTVYAMDTVMNLTVYGENAAAALESAEKELHTLDEAVLSRTAEGSELYALNASNGETVEGGADDILPALIETALTISDATDGAFDPTLAPVLDAWGFTKDERRVPSADELEELLEHEVGVLFGGLLVVVAGADLRVVADAAGAPPRDEAQLRVHLVFGQTVENVAPRVLKHTRVVDVALLVKAGAQLEQALHLLAVLGRVGQRRRDAAAAGEPVERDLDRHDVRIVRRLVQQVDKRVDALVRQRKQQVVLREIGKVVALRPH